MNIKTLLGINLALLLLAANATAQSTRYDARSGGKVRMEGTSTIHPWQVEGKLIGGFLELGAGFPTEPGKAATPGKIEAKGEAFIPVRSMTSKKPDGTPYNTKMDDIMYEKLNVAAHTKITYKLTELTLKEAAKDATSPYVFDSKGDLTIAGKTQAVAIPVNMTPGADGTLKVSLTTNVKMTDFGVEPPAPQIMGMPAIKTGDDVKIIIEWNLAQKKAAK